MFPADDPSLRVKRAGEKKTLRRSVYFIAFSKPATNYQGIRADMLDRDV